MRWPVLYEKKSDECDDTQEGTLEKESLLRDVMDCIDRL